MIFLTGLRILALVFAVQDLDLDPGVHAPGDEPLPTGRELGLHHPLHAHARSPSAQQEKLSGFLGAAVCRGRKLGADLSRWLNSTSRALLEELMSENPDTARLRQDPGQRSANSKCRRLEWVHTICRAFSSMLLHAVASACEREPSRRRKAGAALSIGLNRDYGAAVVWRNLPGHDAADRSVSLLLAEGRVIHGFGAADWRATPDEMITTSAP